MKFQIDRLFSVDIERSHQAVADRYRIASQFYFSLIFECFAMLNWHVNHHLARRRNKHDPAPYRFPQIGWHVKEH